MVYFKCLKEVGFFMFKTAPVGLDNLTGYPSSIRKVPFLWRKNMYRPAWELPASHIRRLNRKLEAEVKEMRKRRKLIEKLNKKRKSITNGQIALLTLENFKAYGRLTCDYCKKILNPEEIVCDHIDNKGDTTLENLTICCSLCNTRKGNKDLKTFIDKLSKSHVYRTNQKSGI